MGMAMYQLGDEVAMADFLNTTWRSIGKDDIYKNWLGGLIEGILFRTAIFNN